MQEASLPGFPEKQNKNEHMIGAQLSLVFNKNNHKLVTLKKRDVIIKKVDLSDKPSKKLLVIDALELGANQTLLAKSLQISRQTKQQELDFDFGNGSMLPAIYIVQYHFVWHFSSISLHAE